MDRIHCLCLLPIVAGVVLLLTITICYLVLVLVDGVNPFLMTISFAGLYIPTQSLFGLGLTWYAIFQGTVLYFKKKHIEMEIRRQRAPSSLNRVNLVLSIFGGAGILAMTVVGNFEMNRELLQIHNAAAGCTFISTTIYSWIHLYLSSKLGLRDWWLLRVCLTVLTTLALLTMIVCLRLFGANNVNNASWSSAVAEYALVICTLLQYMSFALEFRNLGFDVSLFEKQPTKNEFVVLQD